MKKARLRGRSRALERHIVEKLRSFVTASGFVAAGVSVANLVVGTVGGLVLAAPDIPVAGGQSLIDVRPIGEDVSTEFTCLNDTRFVRHGL